jgi:hypothetical protein
VTRDAGHIWLAMDAQYRDQPLYAHAEALYHAGPSASKRALPDEFDPPPEDTEGVETDLIIEDPMAEGDEDDESDGPPKKGKKVRNSNGPCAGLRCSCGLSRQPLAVGKSTSATLKTRSVNGHAVSLWP